MKNTFALSRAYPFLLPLLSLLAVATSVFITPSSAIAQIPPIESSIVSISCDNASGRFAPSLTTDYETAVLAYADIIGGPLLGRQSGVAGPFSINFSAAAAGNYRKVFIVGVANGRDHFLGSATVGPCNGLPVPTPTMPPSYEPTRAPVSQCTPTRTPVPTCALTRTPTPTWTPTPTPTAVTAYTVRPILECVEPLGDGSYRAKFGYENAAPYTVTIPVGARNSFSDPYSTIIRPTCFKSGKVSGAVYVTVTSGTVTWILGERSALASMCAPRCSPNKPPMVKLQRPGSLKCQGAETKISLDATESTDPDGDTLSFEWSTNCAAARLDNPKSAKASLILTEPGKGHDANCQAQIAVSDGKNTTSETLPLVLAACPLDCKGVPNGSTTVDQCGVCSGNGSTCPAPHCDHRNHSETKNKIDAATSAQHEVVTFLVNRLQELTHDEKDRQLVRDLLARANQIATNQKETIKTQIPEETMHCPKNSPCAKWDLRPYQATIVRNSSDFHCLSKKIARRIQQLTRRGCVPQERKQLKLMRDLHEKIQKVIKELPSCASVC